MSVDKSYEVVQLDAGNDEAELTKAYKFSNVTVSVTRKIPFTFNNGKVVDENESKVTHNGMLRVAYIDGTADFKTLTFPSKFDNAAYSFLKREDAEFEFTGMGKQCTAYNKSVYRSVEIKAEDSQLTFEHDNKKHQVEMGDTIGGIFLAYGDLFILDDDDQKKVMYVMTAKELSQHMDQVTHTQSDEINKAFREAKEALQYRIDNNIDENIYTEDGFQVKAVMQFILNYATDHSWLSQSAKEEATDLLKSVNTMIDNPEQAMNTIKQSMKPAAKSVLGLLAVIGAAAIIGLSIAGSVALPPIAMIFCLAAVGSVFLGYYGGSRINDARKDVQMSLYNSQLTHWAKNQDADNPAKGPIDRAKSYIPFVKDAFKPSFVN